MDFSALRDYLDELTTRWKVPACGLTIRIGRETVFEERRNTAPGDLFWLYSATKVFTATMFCRLLEQGVLKLEDRVSDYLPEYAELTIADTEGTLRPAKNPLTLGQLITMCGGLTYNIFDSHITEATDRTTRGIVREIAKMPLISEPGEAFNYSLCHDVLAGVMEVATGTRYARLLEREITRPLGMKDTVFHPDNAQSARFAPQYRWRGLENGAEVCPGTNQFCFSPDYDSGGAGLCSSLEDYILLPEALANGGMGRNGYPLLKPESVEELRRNRLTPSQREGWELRWLRLGSYGYGLGVRTRLNQEDGSPAGIGEFGWDGAAGAYCIADPARKLSVFYVQHVLEMGPVFDKVHPKLRDLVYECLDK